MKLPNQKCTLHIHFYSCAQTYTCINHTHARIHTYIACTHTHTYTHIHTHTHTHTHLALQVPGHQDIVKCLSCMDNKIVSAGWVNNCCKELLLYLCRISTYFCSGRSMGLGVGGLNLSFLLPWCQSLCVMISVAMVMTSVALVKISVAYSARFDHKMIIYEVATITGNEGPLKCIFT